MIALSLMLLLPFNLQVHFFCMLKRNHFFINHLYFHYILNGRNIETSNVVSSFHGHSSVRNTYQGFGSRFYRLLIIHFRLQDLLSIKTRSGAKIFTLLFSHGIIFICQISYRPLPRYLITPIREACYQRRDNKTSINFRGASILLPVMKFYMFQSEYLFSPFP